MAIYKLGDIADIKRGSSPRPIHEWLRPQGLPWAKISDLNGNLIAQTKEFVDSAWERKGLIGNRGDLFITNSASPGIPFMQEADTAIAYHDGFLFINPKKEIILKKFLLYKLIIDRPKLVKMGNGAVFINLSSEILKNWIVDIPTLKVQQQIIDIIEQNEKLFLAYSNCVRIDSVDNVQSDMKKLIDIIEPVEAFENNISKLVRAIELLTKNLESNSGYVFGDFVSIIKNKPKNIKQVSAKVLNRRTSLISQLENPNTYTTNNFFAPKGTLVINTIRTYLEKFGLLYDDADANGTLAMFEMKDATSVFHNLLNDDFWSQALLLSHGTKMPVIKTKDLLSINARKTETEIVGLQNLLISLATLSTRISNLKNRLINLLII